MSGAISEAPEGYRPRGKHRFGLQLLGFVALTGLVIWAAHHFLGDVGIGRFIVWLFIALVWMARCVRSILAPERDREREASERSLGSIRIESVVLLMIWTAFATINAWEIAASLRPGIAS